MSIVITAWELVTILTKTGQMPPTSDKGRFEVTKDEDDITYLKSETEKRCKLLYFHDGHITNLNKAIKVMGKHQLNVNLNNRDINDIKTFLGSLTAKELKFLNKLFLIYSKGFSVIW